MQPEPEIKIGDWVVLVGEYGSDMHPLVKEVMKVTKRTISCITIFGERAVSRLKVMAVFDNEEGANGLLNKIRSILGERDRRVSCAHLWAEKQVQEAIEKSTAPAPPLPPQPTNGDDSHVG